MKDQPMTDIARLIDELTLDEKASLTAGADLWSTVPIPRLGIPSVLMSDGPAGARDTDLFAGTASVCVPCGAALAATWDPELVARVGSVIGEDARAKSLRILLGPTVNLHRSPLGGRNFECYSEDPLLSGRMAAAFVTGVQSHGVATAVKHFVGNDAETERTTVSSSIDERTLRELYLLPFEIAVRDGGALGVMAGYNRLNGRWCTEQRELLTTILRDEWGFEGFVVTDWFGVADSVDSMTAGLDLEMPGPGRAFGPAVADAVTSGALDEKVLDTAVHRLLSVFDRIGALADDDGPAGSLERAIDRPEHRALLRKAATDAMVLLENDGTLPLDPASITRLAVIGPNADRAQIMGGGSAMVTPLYLDTPLDALRRAVGERVEVVHEPGCDIDRSVPPLAGPITAAYYAGTELDGEIVGTSTFDDGQLIFFGAPAPDVPDDFSMRASTMFTPDVTGDWEFTVAQIGLTRLLVDGEVVVDGVTHPLPPGHAIYGFGSIEARATVALVAGTPAEIGIEFRTGDAPPPFRAVRIGARPPVPTDLIARAVAAAQSADAVVLVVGTNPDWESEGRDRDSMDLPGPQHELIERVVAVNPRTVVVVNAGSPVTMSWADRSPAVLQSWFGGQEMANALADVITGAAEPGGRLPTSHPLRLEHNPSYGNFPGANSEVRYGEGLLVGYRWYDTRHLPVRYPFGHGLSYTRFSMGAPVAPSRFEPGTTVTIEVPVTNDGDRSGVEVVQCYVEPLAPTLPRPTKELKAFAKVALAPDATATVTLTLDDRSFAHWHPGERDWPAIAERASVNPVHHTSDRRIDAGWVVDPGPYLLHIGRSVADIEHVIAIEVAHASPI